MAGPETIAKLFHDAKQWHQQGDFEHAAAAYNQILALQPDHAGAWQFIGVLAAQRADYDRAINALKISLEHAPDVAGAWFNLGRCYLSTGNPGLAIDAWQRALVIDPARDDVRMALVPVLLEQKAEAEAIFDLLRPKLEQHLDDWRWAEWAARCYLQQSDFLHAIEYWDQALRLGGDPVTLGANKANLLAQTGQYHDSRQLATQILALQPDHVGARTALGWASLGLEDSASALDAFTPLYQANPDDQNLRLGYALAQIPSNLAIAKKLIETTLQQHPDDINYLMARGSILIAQRDFASAITLYRDLIAKNPDQPQLWQSLGFAIEQHGGAAEAQPVYQHALSLFPTHKGLRLGFGRCALALSDGTNGWPAYENRFGECAQFPRTPGNGWPVWNPDQPIDHLVIYNEQGIGDCFQFLRYINLVPDHVGKITLLVPQSVHGFLHMQPLLRNVTLASHAAHITNADAAVSLMSLPFHLTPDEYCRPMPPYLHASPTMIARWQTRLNSLPAGIRIGLNWQGSKKYRLDDLRSPPLQHFECWLGWRDVIFVNLQQGEGHEQLACTAFGAHIVDWTTEMDRGADQAFVDTAALLCGLDLVITSDTALAHLAGGLGVPTWLLTPASPDWRWGVTDSTSPWYPHMRLFRQTTTGDWNGVAKAVDQAWRNGEGLDFAGSLAFQRGDFAGAVYLLRQACALVPGNPEYRGKLALALNETGQYRALAAESIALNQIAPASVMARLVTCWADFHSGDTANALANIAVLRTEYPHHPSVNAAAVMIALPQDPAQAGLWASAWIEAHPNDLNMRLNLAMTAARQLNWNQAITVLTPALPDPMAWLEQLRYYGFRDGPVATLPKVNDFLTHFPDHPDGMMLRSQYRLAAGPSHDGWHDYEARLETGTALPGCLRENVTRWDGRPNPAGHILIDEEQGIGDVFQFLRFVPLARARVGRLSLRIRRSLIPLLRDQPVLKGVEITSSDETPAIDAAAPIMSLPFLLGTGAAVGLQEKHRLYPDADVAARWAKRLAALPDGRKIGLNWQGSAGYSADYMRSVPLRLLEPLTQLADIQFINLQQGFGHDQIAQSAIWSQQLIDWTADMDGPERAFVDSAALLSQLDIFITSDTAIAHLAGILGVPTWLMVSARPDWRWGISGTECLWYPSMRLFRQPALGDWGAVVKNICQQLSS